MHDHARGAASGLEGELSDVLQAAGIPLAYVLDDPDESGTRVITSGIALLTDAEGAVIVSALAHDGYDMSSGTAEEETICLRARQALQRLGYPVTPSTMSYNTLRVTARSSRG